MRVVVRMGARLHLGFIDLNGDCGRLFGSLGVAIERPRTVVEARPATSPEAQGESPDETHALLAELGGNPPAGRAVAVRVLEAIPRHVGLGSGTQLGLAVGLAASRILGRPLSVRELALLAGRGRRSGVGIALFEHGGFAVDAGQPMGLRATPGTEPLPDEAPPPVIFRHPIPDDWRFVLATPLDARGLSGSPEERVFRTLPPMSGEAVGRICRLTLMKVAPAVMTDDVQGFGEAITEIQLLVGKHFAPYQGGVYASPTGKRTAELALKRGAAGVGQSSWGPTVFALVRGEPAAAGLAEELGALLGDDAVVSCTPARNRGATCRVEA
jgi:beta-ribofuranosylaminobenzene 5'-phosphate synthase